MVSARPSAREGGLAKIPACIYDFSALESEMVDVEDIVVELSDGHISGKAKRVDIPLWQRSIRR